MKNIALPVAVCLALLSATPISYAATPGNVGSREASATEFLEQALSELLRVLSDESLGEAARQKSVENIVRKRLDYAEFSRFVLARDRDRFSEEQLSRYECEFDAYLSHYVGSRLVRYHQEQIEVTRATAMASGDVVLSARISGGQYDQSVVTFLVRKSGSNPDGTGLWRAIDVAFEGTKVRKLLRAQFESVLDDGPDRLIAILREKTPGESSCGAPADEAADKPE
jgi:ABC-type transporter MlaC component